jgi:hypothetical protein
VEISQGFPSTGRSYAVKTECTPKQVDFDAVGRRKLVAAFDAKHISSDGGLALLHRADGRFGLMRKFAACVQDLRAPELVHHPVEQFVRQRMFGIACGYEDLVDHAALREDPLLAAVVGKAAPAQKLASPSTLNRLELTPADATAQVRYPKVVYDAQAIERFFVDAFLDAPPSRCARWFWTWTSPMTPSTAPKRGVSSTATTVTIATCRFTSSRATSIFHLCAKLRTSGIDAATGALEEVQRIVARIRERWPDTRLVLPADSDFTRDDIMAWCEDLGVDFVFGLARNRRLEEMIAADLGLVRAVSLEERDGAPTRAHRELRYRTRNSWTRERRVVAKAEWLGDKSNPRFVVTSFCEQAHPAQALYEALYYAGGDMENRIKEQQLGFFADRTSAHTLCANQLRLWFSSVAYVLLNLLRHFGLKGTELERAQAGTIRLKLLKVAALVRISVRRVVLSLSAAAPVKDLFARIAEQLRTVPAPS